MQIVPAGDRALLLTLRGASAARLRAIAEAVGEKAGAVAAIVGYDSVYVVGTSDVDAVARAAGNAGELAGGSAREHRIEVSFAREHALDFDVFLARAQVSRDDAVNRITGLTLIARYLGFRAGFAYLEGWPEEWSLPRRPTSRNHIPGGSFAVAGVMAGFYPIDSPGGWNILGRTDSLPQLLPGDEIRILPVDRSLVFPESSGDQAGKLGSGEAGKVATADVIFPGQLTTVAYARDWRHSERGESPGGPFDDDAASVANHAVGNTGDAPLLECVLVGPRLRFRTARRVAWCGPSCQPRTWNAGAGEEIDIGRIRDGFRGYLAIEGGVSAMGKVISVWAGFSRPDRLKPVATQRGNRLMIRVMAGPHDAPPLPQLWEVTPNINRVGIRLRPLTLVEASLPAELPSCGMQFGTVQWHPDGSIVMMGPDHPVTGGYLQPATVISADLWKLGQLAPGEQVRLARIIHEPSERRTRCNHVILSRGDGEGSQNT